MIHLLLHCAVSRSSCNFVDRSVQIAWRRRLTPGAFEYAHCGPYDPLGKALRRVLMALAVNGSVGRLPWILEALACTQGTVTPQCHEHGEVLCLVTRMRAASNTM